MKRLIIVLVAVLLLGGIAFAQTASIRQTFVGYGTSGATFTIAYSGVTVGDILVAGCVGYGAGPTCSYGDTHNAYSSEITYGAGSGTTHSGLAWKVADVTSGTLTITMSGASYAGGVIFDIENPAASSPVESTCVGYTASASSGTTSCSTTMSMTGTSEVAVAIASAALTSKTWTPGTGYSCDYVLGTSTHTCGTAYIGLAEHEAWTSSPPGTTQPAATMSATGYKMSIAGLVVKGSVPTVATPTFSPVAGAYGPAQTVAITSATSGSTICYTTNGDTPTAATPGTCDSDSGHESSISNGGTMTVSATETVKAIGTLSGDTNSSVGSAAYTINGAASTPTFSPVAGAYSGTKNVTISCSTGPTACYNTTGSPATNGSTGCTTGTLVSGTVAVTGSETLYAVCGGTAYSDSSVGSAAYTISAATSPPLMTLIGVGP